MYIETLPSVDEPLSIVGAGSTSPYRWIAHLDVTSSGALEFGTSNTREPISSQPKAVRTGRWTHVAVVHSPQKASSLNIR